MGIAQVSPKAASFISNGSVLFLPAVAVILWLRSEQAALSIHFISYLSPFLCPFPGFNQSKVVLLLWLPIFLGAPRCHALTLLGSFHPVTFLRCFHPLPPATLSHVSTDVGHGWRRHGSHESVVSENQEMFSDEPVVLLKIAYFSFLRSFHPSSRLLPSTFT